MKKLIIFFFMLISIGASAQFKIENKIYTKGFLPDTATNFSLKVVSLDVQKESISQRPVFYFAVYNKKGEVLNEANIYYSDMVNAMNKKSIPESEHQQKIYEAYCAVLCGSLQQKLYVLRYMLSTYDIIVKPDDMQ